MRSVKLSWDLRTFIVISVLIAVPANLILVLLPSDYIVGNYVDSTSVELLFFGVLLFLLVIPHVKDKSFRSTSILLTIGFALQLLASSVWYYYGHMTEFHVIPRTGIGDVLHLSSFIIWAAAVAPYIGRYRRLLSGRSLSAIITYSAIAATVVVISVDYWFKAVNKFGYNPSDAATQLLYVLIPAFALAAPLTAAVIYGLDGHGLALKRYYWMYFLLPICLLASADILRGFYFVVNEASVPWRFDDILRITAFSMTISAALRLLRSQAGADSISPITLEKGTSQVMLRLTGGKGYLIEDPKGELGFQIFHQLLMEDGVERTDKGYIISRTDPVEIAEVHGLKGHKFMQLAETDKKPSGDGDELAALSESIGDFCKRTERSSVLLDGVEPFIVKHGFRKVRLMLEQVSDSVAEHRCYMLVTIDPKVLSKKETERIERIFKAIRVGGPEGDRCP